MRYLHQIYSVLNKLYFSMAVASIMFNQWRFVNIEVLVPCSFTFILIYHVSDIKRPNKLYSTFHFRIRNTFDREAPSEMMNASYCLAQSMFRCRQIWKEKIYFSSHDLVHGIYRNSLFLFSDMMWVNLSIYL